PHQENRIPPSSRRLRASPSSAAGSPRRSSALAAVAHCPDKTSSPGGLVALPHTFHGPERCPSRSPETKCARPYCSSPGALPPSPCLPNSPLTPSSSRSIVPRLSFSYHPMRGPPPC